MERKSRERGQENEHGEKNKVNGAAGEGDGYLTRSTSPWSRVIILEKSWSRRCRSTLTVHIPAYRFPATIAAVGWPGNDNGKHFRVYYVAPDYTLCEMAFENGSWNDVADLEWQRVEVAPFSQLAACAFANGREIR